MSPAFIPSFEKRAFVAEQMDDLSLDDGRLESALRDLRRVNRYLGGYRTLSLAMAEILEERKGGELTILDLGAGAADHAERLVTWGVRSGVDVRVTAVDANPAVVRFAQSEVNQRLSRSLRKRVEIRQGDALQIGGNDSQFDVVTASLFLHHFDDGQCVVLLQEMARLAAIGIIINDLHRHALAYLGFRTIGAALRLSPMARHDGPVSVRRAFLPEELSVLARRAGLPSYRIERHWAYRLSLSTIPS